MSRQHHSFRESLPGQWPLEAVVLRQAHGSPEGAIAPSPMLACWWLNTERILAKATARRKMLGASSSLAMELVLQ